MPCYLTSRLILLQSLLTHWDPQRERQSYAGFKEVGQTDDRVRTARLRLLLCGLIGGGVPGWRRSGAVLTTGGSSPSFPLGTRGCK